MLVVLQLMIKHSPSCLKINIADNCESFIVVCNAKNSAGALNKPFPF